MGRNEEGEGKPLFQNKDLLAPGPGLKKLQVSLKVAVDLVSIDLRRHAVHFRDANANALP